MKKFLFLVSLFFTAFSFAQQSLNSFVNKKKSTSNFLLPYKSKYSLNLDFFKLEKVQKSFNSLSELFRESNSQRSRPIDNMPIFEPKGKFYLEISPVDENIDYKLKIFSLEKSKYYSREVG